MATTSGAVTITRNQQRFASWMTDVLVYIVVLNLFVEFVDAVVIDSFWISILTAVLLKLILDVLAGVEHRVSHYFKERGGVVSRILGIVSTFLILFLSKFAILEIVDIVFGDHVDLGHFIEIVGLIVSMIGAKLIFHRIYDSLGDSRSASTL